MPSVVDTIRDKRNGKELTGDQIKDFVDKLVSSDKTSGIHDAQIGAFLMAVRLNGLSARETADLTQSMTSSGFTFTWPEEWKGTLVDKHSTGGVGDKVSLPLAPALAACGLRVPMVSGRGLDFTGGTLDKLESIPGFNVTLDAPEIRGMLSQPGCCIVGQTKDLVPADKILYAIRDITATVDNDTLIVASIISKKAAEGLDALVLDVKTGSGSLMNDIESARRLAIAMVNVGKTFGMKVTAYLTDMDQPLGRAVGNALEVAESIDCLKGQGPEDLHTLIVTFGGKLLHLTGKAPDDLSGQRQIDAVLRNGAALVKFEEMIIGQGTSSEAAHELCHGDKWKVLPKAENVTLIKSPVSGYVCGVDALAVARVCHSLGCGRTKPGFPVKSEPGIVLLKKAGDEVSAGDVLMELHSSSSSPIEVEKQILLDAVLIQKEGCGQPIHPRPPPRPLILDILQ